MPSQSVLEQKKVIVEELTARLKNSVTGLVVSYEGINTEDDTKLRKELRENNVHYSVVKNTLLSRACDEVGLEGIKPVLEVQQLSLQATANTLLLQESSATMLRITITLRLSQVTLTALLLIWIQSQLFQNFLQEMYFSQMYLVHSRHRLLLSQELFRLLLIRAVLRLV